MQYVTLRKRKDDWESVTTSHPEYIRFYNSLWLVANDVIIGIALGSYIIENAGWVADSISDILSLYSVAALQRRIAWLMGYPAGLKLNNELAAFLGDLFLWVIDHWSSMFPSCQRLTMLMLHRLHRNATSNSASNGLGHRFLKFRRS
jgi:phosphatidylinositol glycan class Q protein